MSNYNPTSPLTGAAQTGFTSPTYTLSSDVAPDSNGIQHAVTTLGGTQGSADAHSVSKPFTLTWVRPKVFRALGRLHPVTGVLTQVPRNVWKAITRKGVTPLSGQADVPMLITTKIEVPAGADIADPDNIRAAISAHIGLLNDQASTLGDSSISGVM